MAATHAATGQELITLVIRESDARAAAACGLAACGQASEYYSPACSGNKHRFALPPSRKLKYKYKNTKTNTKYKYKYLRSLLLANSTQIQIQLKHECKYKDKCF